MFVCHSCTQVLCLIVHVTMYDTSFDVPRIQQVSVHCVCGAITTDRNHEHKLLYRDFICKTNVLKRSTK